MNTVVVTNHQMTNSELNSESSSKTDPQTDSKMVLETYAEWEQVKDGLRVRASERILS